LSSFNQQLDLQVTIGNVLGSNNYKVLKLYLIFVNDMEIFSADLLCKITKYLISPIQITRSQALLHYSHLHGILDYVKWNQTVLNTKRSAVFVKFWSL